MLTSTRYLSHRRSDSQQRLPVQSRITSFMAALIALSMVVFGQVCALSTLVSLSDAMASEVSIEGQSGESAGHQGCSSETCGGDRKKSGGPCPSGAAMCCSTWAPPSGRLELTQPALLRLPLNDFSVDHSGLNSVEDRAAEVALFEFDRPPGTSGDPLLTSSLSRRGPPASS